jgi:hypothetical protein
MSQADDLRKLEALRAAGSLSDKQFRQATDKLFSRPDDTSESWLAARYYAARFAWVNLNVAVWVLIAVCCWNIHTLTQMSPRELRDTPTSHLNPSFVIPGFEIMLWLWFYRGERKGARLMAGIEGAMLTLAYGIAPLLMADVYQHPVNWPVYSLGLYIALSHLGYAILGQEDS